MPHVPPPKRHPYDQWSPDARALDLVGDKWTLLIVRDLAAGPRRFVELQRVLPGISTEQLRSRLNRMVADGMLTRKRYREVPPRVDYELTDRARDLLPILGELARWGYEWAWGPPRATESVDIGAIFRLAPALIRSEALPTATAHLTIGDGKSETVPVSYALTVSPERVAIEERTPEHADTRIAGDTAAWVRALSPDNDRAGLEISGDRELAERLLAALTAGNGTFAGFAGVTATA
ncbi:MAG: helix-turn-helix domain-containing protein [Solirubrobacteraceae bacterium]|jgi:DNA-binding HxlR family transcriptional regulator